MTWQPNSWRDHPILQVPTYPSQDKVDEVEAVLAKSRLWSLLVKCKTFVSN